MLILKLLGWEERGQAVTLRSLISSPCPSTSSANIAGAPPFQRITIIRASVGRGSHITSITSHEGMVIAIRLSPCVSIATVSNFNLKRLPVNMAFPPWRFRVDHRIRDHDKRSPSNTLKPTTAPPSYRHRTACGFPSTDGAIARAQAEAYEPRTAFNSSSARNQSSSAVPSTRPLASHKE